ncbi:MAG: HIRAN domain-containing protein [Clostridia bacterium]|nr:HIRAN domain-containing protein [Clostridia bacterium]
MATSVVHTVASRELQTPTVLHNHVETKERDFDESVPKSVPKKETDRYIKKRMTIAGSSYCDQTVLEKLTVGTYFDLIAENDNPYDKDAVMLVYQGEKIGYVAKSERLAYVTCLRLKRGIYGVITDIKTDVFPPQYEYETWFEGR